MKLFPIMAAAGLALTSLAPIAAPAQADRFVVRVGGPYYGHRYYHHGYYGRPYGRGYYGRGYYGRGYGWRGRGWRHHGYYR